MPLLQTKLYAPLARPLLAPRPQLIARLHEQGIQPLTLLTAPAGFGKTTLVSAWIAQQAPPVAWLSLDDEDNDPTRFLTYLIAALQTCQPQVGTTALALLGTPPALPLKTLLTLLLNDLSALSAPLVLVLDDYHVITAPPIHEALTFLIDHLSSSLHLVMTTRVDPPLPLARWRVRNQLTELRADDLRFTLDEAADFLNERRGLQLTAAEIATLTARTEGWIAGLQLAGLAMQTSTDRATFVRNFSGSHRYVVDYLVDEVLNRLPAPTQRFLLQTAILEQLCAGLCDAVLSQREEAGTEISPPSLPLAASSQQMLEELDRANLFLIPLDGERRWYRYYQFFADLLRYRLQQIEPALLPELHRRASTWYTQAGLSAEAIRHALGAGNVARAADLIEESAMPVLWQGQVSTLTSWLESLPIAVVRSRPRLSLAQVWAAVLTGAFEAIETSLQDVEQRLGAMSDALAATAAEAVNVQGQVTALRALAALNQNNWERALILCEQALAQLPPDNSLVRGLVLYYLGHAERQRGHNAAAQRAFGEAITLGQAAGNLMLAIYAATGLAELAEVQGQLHQAASRYQQALQLATVRDGQPLPLAGAAYVGLGKVWREWNDLAQAADHLARGIELGRQGGVEGIILDGSITLALVRQAQGDEEGAHTLIQQMTQLAQKWKQPATIIRVAAFAARLWLAQGQREPVMRWVRTAGVQVDDEPHEQLEIEHITLGRILLAQGAWDEAQRLLERLVLVAQATGRLGRVIELLILQALVFQGRSELEAARITLRRALSLAEPEGYIRMFVDEGAAMRLLILDLRFWLEEQRSDPHQTKFLAYIDELLSAFPAPCETQQGRGDALPPSQKPSSKSVKLVEPLSERELEVLHLIAAGLSNREIAGQLIISFDTVRKHVENIRGKLGVTSRLQAVNQARTIGLL